MELKCTNPNGEIVIEKKLNLMEFFFSIVKIAFKNESYKLFFQEYALLAPKQDCL